MSMAVVVGGMGFIGSNLATKLDKPIILDDGSNSDFKNKPDENIYKATAGSLGTLMDAFGKKPDVVYHLGMPSSSPMYSNRELVGKTINEFLEIMEYARKTGVKVVYASSSSVYNGGKIPSTEFDRIIPTDFYTETRYAIDRLATLYNGLYGVKVIGLRLFSVYGNDKCKGKYANLITQMTESKKNKETFELWCSETTRDFIHVDDVTDAFILAGKSELEFGLFNVGTGIDTSLIEVADKIGVNIKILNKYPVNYVKRTLANMDWTNKNLKFKAKVKLNDYLKDE